MRFIYECEKCGRKFAELCGVQAEKLGFDCLTEEECEAIISFDNSKNALCVKSFCDSCLNSNGADEKEVFLH